MLENVTGMFSNFPSAPSPAPVHYANGTAVMARAHSENEKSITPYPIKVPSFSRSLSPAGPLPHVLCCSDQFKETCSSLLAAPSNQPHTTVLFLFVLPRPAAGQYCFVGLFDLLGKFSMEVFRKGSISS